MWICLWRSLMDGMTPLPVRWNQLPFAVNKFYNLLLPCSYGCKRRVFHFSVVTKCGKVKNVDLSEEKKDTICLRVWTTLPHLKQTHTHSHTITKTHTYTHTHTHIWPFSSKFPNLSLSHVLFRILPSGIYHPVTVIHDAFAVAHTECVTDLD